MRFVITGVVHARDGNRITRTDMEILLTHLGHTLQKAIRHDTDYLVVGDNVSGSATNKMVQAEVHRTPTLTEGSFIQMMSGQVTQMFARDLLDHGTPRVGASDYRTPTRYEQHPDGSIRRREPDMGDLVGARVSAPTHPDEKQREPEKVTVSSNRKRKIRVRQHTKVDYT